MKRDLQAPLGVVELLEADALPGVARLGPNFFGLVFVLMKLAPALRILRRAAAPVRVRLDKDTDSLPFLARGGDG